MTNDNKYCSGSDTGKDNENKGCCGSNSKNKCGSGSVAALVVLVLVAIGVFIYITNEEGKTPLHKDKVIPTASKQSNAEEETQGKSSLPKDTNPVLAIVDGDEVKRLDVLEFINTMPAQMREMPVEQIFSMALEQIINNKIIDKKASNSGLENDEAIKTQLEQIKKQLIRAKFLEITVEERITEETITAKYEEYVQSFPEVEEVKASHILVDDENLAKSIIEKLDSGADFADLAKESSKDGSSANGGELGYFTETDVVPAFAEAAFATEVGYYTKTPVKTAFGYHIIKVDDKRKRKPADYEQIKPYIKQEMLRTTLDNIISSWKTEVEIKRFDINGNPLPAEDSKDTQKVVEPKGSSNADINANATPKPSSSQ